MSKIEELIDEIQNYVESCKYQALSTTKIVVNKEELLDLLRELELKTPEEIKKYQKIISNRDAIIKDAQDKADQIIEDAQHQAKEMVEENAIMQQAYTKANALIEDTNSQAQDIIDRATEDANTIRVSAVNYTTDLMSSLEQVLGDAKESFEDRFRGLQSSIENYHDVVKHNLAELKENE